MTTMVDTSHFKRLWLFTTKSCFSVVKMLLIITDNTPGCQISIPPHNFNKKTSTELQYFLVLLSDKQQYVYLLCYVCIALLTLDAGLLARSQYPECPATGHLDTGFSWFPCVYKRMLICFPSFQVATTCFSCSPPNLNFSSYFFLYLCTCKITTATGWQPNCS